MTVLSANSKLYRPEYILSTLPSEFNACRHKSLNKWCLLKANSYASLAASMMIVLSTLTATQWDLLDQCSSCRYIDAISTAYAVTVTGIQNVQTGGFTSAICLPSQQANIDTFSIKSTFYAVLSMPPVELHISNRSNTPLLAVIRPHVARRVKWRTLKIWTA